MRFTKMQGAGNDYIYINCFDETLSAPPATLAIRLSDRHFGIGGDGLVLIGSSRDADARMRMFNADGSESEMCGNAIRCVAKYVYEHRLCRRPSMTIETGAGILTLECEIKNERVVRVRVDMGSPILQPSLVPTTIRMPNDENAPIVNYPLEIEGHTFPATIVSMGNPHCVLFVDSITDEFVLGLGPKLEKDARFPKRINVEFVEVISKSELRMRVWERGTGETLACGTGACATAVAAHLSGRASRSVQVHLLGGDLSIEWLKDNHVCMTGPAVEVFSGEID